MTDQESYDLETVRAKAQEIVEHLKNDTAFRTKVESDPSGALVAAGLPAAAVGDFLPESDLGEVVGYMRCCRTCLCTCNCPTVM